MQVNSPCRLAFSRNICHPTFTLLASLNSAKVACCPRGTFKGVRLQINESRVRIKAVALSPLLFVPILTRHRSTAQKKGHKAQHFISFDFIMIIAHNRP